MPAMPPTRERSDSRILRQLLAAGVLVLAVVAGAALLSLLDTALSVTQRLATLPAWLRWSAGLGLGALALGSGWVVWRLLRPRPVRTPRATPIDRDTVQARLDALPPDQLPAARADLQRLDAPDEAGRIRIALFGEVSSGKTSLLRALCPDAGLPADAIDVRAGSTRAVHHAEGRLPDGTPLHLADVPGTNDAAPGEWTRMAEREAAQAHVLLVVVDGDLSRSEQQSVATIAGFGKPLLLALNKADQYREAELAALLQRLRTRVAPWRGRVVPVVAGGTERVLLRGPDGHDSMVERPRPPRLDALQGELKALSRLDPAQLQPAREAAVLAGVDADLAEAEQSLRAQRSEATIRRYTRRAVIGALAAVAPGTDLIIQGALATALLRELAAIHGLAVRDLDLDAFVAEAGGVVRKGTTLTLALAGNALKAFPGLGTLGGGLAHAVAYGLVFDSLGHAAARSFAASGALDRRATLDAFRAALEQPARARLEALARLALDARTDAAEPAPRTPGA